ncbi:MAG: transcriptional regulator [Deltaproteobacteria bacterium]|nr:MAG: transcriptional regulator [Deltaproteobacteria bacterium]
MHDKNIKITSAFPERLRRLRRERDWSQGQLANKVGIDIQRISKYERGLSNPPLETLAHIARAFGVSLDYLLMGKSSKTDKLQNTQLIERIEELENLPKEYQETLISVLDSFIKRNKFEELAHG